ncbi:MAG: efflux transporter outer membrane subunit [Chthoniobacteraceae bacterium]|nr:efflux transporter outer membrane subunit [Chthoniobacteraceae bacterium]
MSRPLPLRRLAPVVLVLASLRLHAAPPALPAPRTPEYYKNAPAAAKSAPVLRGRAPWWSVFHDPALDALLCQTLNANQDIQQALARLLEARAQARAAAADYFPHLDAPLRATRQRTTNTGPRQLGLFLGNNAPSASGTAGPFSALFSKPIATQPLSITYNDFRAPLRLTYELDVFGRIRATVGQARANAQAAEADRRALELSLTAQAATGYFTVRALDAQIEVLRRTANLRRTAVKLQRDRVEAGTANQLDLYRAQVELDNTQSDLTDTIRQRGEAENALAPLCGQSASAFHIPAQPLGQRPPPPVPPGVPATLLAQRPDLAQAERKLQAAAEGIRAARADLLPTFNIEGDAGLESAHFDQLFEGQSRTWMVEGTISIPIFEGGRNVANLRAAKARREEAFAAYHQAALTAFKEVENALVDLRQRATQAGFNESAAANAGRVAALSQQRYEEGQVSYFEVIDAQRLQLGAELTRIQTLNARYAATVDLIRALGGKWDPVPNQ